MSEPLGPGVGTVFSADIAVPDQTRAARFYSRVLSTGAEPLWRADDLMNNLGMPVIGVGARSADLAHLPLQWMPHIQVADVAASVQRAHELGGSVLMHAQHEDGTSQWAVLGDPQGAAFGIIPVIPAEAIPPASPEMASAGRIAWLDLTVADADAARTFYQQVVGWGAQSLDLEDGGQRYADYIMLRDDGSAAAGICHARGVNSGLPPVWMIYLPVGDLAESLRRVPEEGGQIIKAMQGEDGTTVYAAIQDPLGAAVALMPGSRPSAQNDGQER